VLRCFEDPNVTHVEGGVDPKRDRDIVDTELCLKDLESVEKRRERAQRNAKAGGKAGDEAKAELALLDRVKAGLDAGITVRAQKLSPDDHKHLKDLFLLTDKPVLYVANIGESQLGKEDTDSHVVAARKLAKAEGAEMVALAAGIEAEIQQLPPGERPGFLASVGLSEPGLHKVVRAGYRMLGLQTFFTLGEQECRAWTFHKGAKAPEAAASSTPTSSGASSRPRCSAGKTSFGWGARRRSGRRACSGSRARSTSSRTATACTSGSTCSVVLRGGLSLRGQHGRTFVGRA
jgi:ribosome-binding ATPase YchF (GTP1/OBG family)